MQSSDTLSQQSLARYTGIALLASIIIGIVSAMFIAHGIDINLTADVLATAENMLDAELRLRAKAYIALFGVCLEAVISVGLYLLLKKSGHLLAACSLFINLVAAILMLLGAMFAMNAAEFASNAAYNTLTNDGQRLILMGVQATSDYTSFHLGLILTTIANAGFFILFLKSKLIPKLIAGWGVFASLFVVVTMLARDFIPFLGHNTITIAFMLSNMIALVSTGIYLSWKGVREV